MRSRMPTPHGWITWVEGVSDGKCALSSTHTRSPRRASKTANGDPAHRAPDDRHVEMFHRASLQPKNLPLVSLRRFCKLINGQIRAMIRG